MGREAAGVVATVLRYSTLDGQNTHHSLPRPGILHPEQQQKILIIVFSDFILMFCNFLVPQKVKLKGENTNLSARQPPKYIVLYSPRTIQIVQHLKLKNCLHQRRP